MSRFLCIIFMSVIYTYPCLGDGHSAYASFEFYNSLDEAVKLSSEFVEGDKPDGFVEFGEKTVNPKKGICFVENLTNYEEVKKPEDSQVILKINVMVDSEEVGTICLISSILPDPSFVFKTKENNLNLALRIKRTRFGGGRRIIELYSAKKSE